MGEGVKDHYLGHSLILNLSAATPIKDHYLGASIPLVLVVTPGGWTHDLNGVANANIGKVNGVSIANISKINKV